MPIPSQKLSQLAGTQVQINLRPGEDLDQAEQRVLRENPQDFQPQQTKQDSGYEDLVPDQTQVKPLPKQINPSVAAIAGEGMRFPAGSKERSRAIGDAKNVESLMGAEQLKKLTSGLNLEDITSIVNTQKQLKDLIDFKSRGFGGKGIDTGPVVGGGIPLPFTESEIPFVPSGVNEFVNKNFFNEGDNSADRSELRRKQLSLLNPVRKEVTGAAAPYRELMKFIFPTMPSESDNDLAFYKKGIGALGDSQSRLQTILDTIQRSGTADVSGFRDVQKKTPDQVIEELFKQVTQGMEVDQSGKINGSGEYGFGNIMRDTTKKYLQSKDPKKMSDEELLNSL